MCCTVENTVLQSAHRVVDTLWTDSFHGVTVVNHERCHCHEYSTIQHEVFLKQRVVIGIILELQQKIL